MSDCVHMSASEYLEFVHKAHSEFITAKFKDPSHHIVDLAITSTDFFEINYYVMDAFTHEMRKAGCSHVGK